jgi:integrase
MASIDKRPDGTYRLRWREVPGGPQQSKHFARKADALREKAKVEHTLHSGTYIDPDAGRVSFADYAEDWRKIQMHAHGTEVSVEQQLRRHVYPVLGRRPLAGIRTSEIQALVRHLDAKLAPGTVEVVYGRVVAVFRSAVMDRKIAHSPCVGIKLPEKPPASTLQVLTTEQVMDLADAVPAKYRALIIAGAGTGLRPGELFGLTADRIEFLRSQLRVDQQLVRVRGEGVRLSPKLKTKTSYRTLPLAESVKDALAEHMVRYDPHPELGLVFTNEWSKPIQQHPFAMTFEHARVKAGIPAWVKGDKLEPPTPHDLRHYYASLLIRSNGNNPKLVQARLGHASAKTTLDTYGHLFPDEEDRTRTVVDDAFSRLRAERAEDLLRTEPTAD